MKWSNRHGKTDTLTTMFAINDENWEPYYNDFLRKEIFVYAK